MSTRHWQRPTAFAVLLTVFGIVAFIGLGVWQLDRAAGKERLLARYAEVARQAPVPFDKVRGITDELHYPHVRIHGHYLADRSYLLDEQAHGDQIGVHVIAVFAGDNEDQLLLVDRGWVPWRHAPGTTPKYPPLTSASTSLTGIYASYPGTGLRIGGNALARETQWPKLTLYLDHADIAADLGKPVFARMLLLDPDPHSGFVREWKPNVLPPQRHQAYAVQWFGFAIVALLIFLSMHWKKEHNAHDESQDA